MTMYYQIENIISKKTEIRKIKQMEMSLYYVLMLETIRVLQQQTQIAVYLFYFIFFFFSNQLLILNIFQSLETLREFYNKYSSLSLLINSYFTIFTPSVFLSVILKSSCRYHDTSHLNISSCFPKYNDHTHETLTYCII